MAFHKIACRLHFQKNWTESESIWDSVSYDKPIQFGYTGTSDELLRQYIDDNQELYGSSSGDLPINCVGATIGTHAGPGAIACAFFSRK